MKVIVLGAGAIGSLYAAKLSSLHDVTIVGRAAHVDAINEHGLRVTGREEMTCRIRAATEVEAVPPGALLLLTTKVNDNRRAVEPLAAKLRHDTIILCVQNGLGGEEIVKAAIGARCPVMRAITQFGAIFQAPGVVEYKAEGYTIVERDPHGARIADLLTASGLDGRLVDDIRVEVWRKLIFNCVINPITSITGREVGSIADPRLDPLKRLVIDECLAVARRAGVSFDADPGFDFLPAVAAMFGRSTNVASMRQDLLKGRATEIEFMNGAVVELGRRLGIDCPVNAALAAIVKAMEAGRSFVVP